MAPHSRVFSSLWQLCPSGVWAWMWQFLGSQGHWQCQLHKGACRYCHRRYDTIRAGFSPWQLCPSENWVWMWHSCLDRGDSSVLGHQLPQSQEIWPYKSLSSLWKLVIRRPLWLVLLCCLACQELKRPVSLGSFSIVQLSVLVCGERESNGDGCTPYVWLNSITLPAWLPGFLPQAFPMVISIMSPLAVSLPSKAWDCTPVPMLQLPAIVLSRGLASLSGVHMAAVRIVCVILIPFRLSQISCFTLSLKCFSSVPNNCLDVEIRALLQLPHSPRQGPILLTLLFFPLLLSSYWILHGSMYSFLVVRYSCLLSVGVLQDLLCLKVNLWCIHGERCTPHLPTALPSWELTS